MVSRPDSQLLHHPTLADDEPGQKATGLDCFLNQNRPCGPDCMAFTAPPEGQDYQDQQWAHCMLLVNAHRGGKHLVVLASLGTELSKKAKTEAADRARAQQPAPPKVG